MCFEKNNNKWRKRFGLIKCKGNIFYYWTKTQKQMEINEYVRF